MIVSHKHKFIFIAIPSTGTTSIQETLEQIFDIKTDNFDVMEDDFSPVERGGMAIRKHSEALVIRDIIGDYRFNSYYKFCFVRNPWDHIACQYFFSRKHPMVPKYFMDGSEDPWHIHVVKCKELGFNDYIIQLRNRIKGYMRYITDEREKIIVDYTGRFENMHADFETACKRIGVKALPVPHLNSTGKGNYRQHYNEESRRIVSDIYSTEIKAFGYAF
jgi:hypothetical protein